MATQSQTFTVTGNWLCPDGVYSVQVELWGGGGPGGPATGTASGAGGGAGGQYAINAAVPVVPGTTYAVSVATAKTAPATTPANGNDTTFASTTVVAKGGAGAVAATGTTGAGAAGSTTGGVGTTVNAGGSGGNGVSSTVSGGGGGGAGSTGTGNSGSGQTAGLAKTNNGGAGGTGVSVAATSNPGNNYGGGGSGGLSSSATDRAGGNGAQGLAVLTWTNPPTEALKDDFSAASVNTNKWIKSGVALGTLTTQSGGLLVFTTSTTNGYGAYDSVEGLQDLTGSYVAIQLVSAGNQALASLEVQPLGLVLDASNSMGWYLNTGTLAAWKKVATARSNVATATYNATTHQWLRIRESGGTTFWDYSTDGFSWTNLTSLANPFAVTGLQQEMSVGTFANEASATTVNMDNYNRLMPVGRDITDSENSPGAIINQSPQRGSFF